MGESPPEPLKTVNELGFLAQKRCGTFLKVGVSTVRSNAKRILETNTPDTTGLGLPYMAYLDPRWHHPN